MKYENMTCENSVDENTIASDAVSADESEKSLKEKYSRLYGIYLDCGYDLINRDYGVDETREEFLTNCIKYVDECPTHGRKKENARIFTNMYKEYVKHGYEGVVKKFAYRRTRDALISRFEQIVPIYDSKARLREIEKGKVEYYTKVYEECKKSGIERAVIKFKCSSNANFLVNKFRRYVKNYVPIKGLLSKANNIKHNDIKTKVISNFWKDFDFNSATLDRMKTYIIEHSDYKNIGNVDKRIHYTVYLIINRKNGKLYIGQHQTDNLDDGYMGSGKILELAKNRYGEENFEKIILFDFNSFDEMNNMEIDIVCDDFIKKRDFVYNRCHGGLNGPSAEFQKEMYRNGRWKMHNSGKVLCHNSDNEFQYFFENEIPYGWVKGGYKDEKLHREIDMLMDELHSLGSNYTWRTGDTVEVLRNHIEQFKKAKVEEERNRILWVEIFDYYKRYGHTKTLAKYKTVNNIVVMDRCFERYLPDEYAAFRTERNEKNENRKKEFERMKGELQSYGIKRPWENYSLFALTRMYNACMKKKAVIDEKVAYYAPLMEECFANGIVFVRNKTGDENIHQKFIKYVPLRYKEYMKQCCGKDIIVEENIYTTIAPRGSKYRKKREASQSELDRREATAKERRRLYEELVSLGSKVTFNNKLALTTLKRSIEQAKIVKKKKDELTKYYVDFYNSIMNIGYKKACAERDYTGTLSNLKKRFKSYVPQYKREDFDTST